MKKLYQTYFRTNLPHIWCPGCGNGIVMSAFAEAMQELEYEQNNTVAVSGIGCSSRITTYLDLNTLHTTHGRALPVATGLKMCAPQLNVFVFMGDGDCAAIGGNHFIHACRRNMDMTAIVINNQIYGMTGGQYSPLSPVGIKATTAPFGTIDRTFDLCQLGKGAGASFIARGDVFHAKRLSQLIAEGARHKGFSLIEVLSICPVGFGRQNQINEPIELMRQLEENTVDIKAAALMNAEALKGKSITGILHNVDIPEYIEEYQRIIDAQSGGSRG